MPGKGTPRRTIRISDQLWSAATRRASSEERDVSDVVREHLERYVGHIDEEQAGEAAPPEQAVSEREPRVAPRKNVASTVYTLRGLTMPLDTVAVLDPAITSEEAAAWDRDLSKALRILRSFHTKVKELAREKGGHPR
jgi:hypothetical protein